MATHYEHVQNILNNAAGGASPGHDGNGRFWDKPLAEFRTLIIYGVQLIADPGPNRGRNSGLIRALKGEAPFDGTMFSRMPLGRSPVAVAEIAFIEDWINADLPNEETDGPTDSGDTDTEEPRPGCAISHANTYRQMTGNVLIRKNIMLLTAEELKNFRTAIQALKDLPASDSRNFIVQAAIHGVSCRHGSELFLPWHRAYLYEFERLLQEQVPGVTLPYWDWVNTREVPEPYRDAVVPDFDPNPLYNASRTPPADGSGLPTASDENAALALANWPEFGGMPIAAGMAGAVEASNHNTVHGWVSGDIGTVPTAGLDPLFWALHCDVDRIWAVWQTTHSGRPSDSAAVLDPFGMTVGETASVRALGYDYAGLDSSSIMDSTQGCANYCAPPQELPEPIIERGCCKAWVCLYGIVHPKDSYRIRIYLNYPAADSGSDTTSESGYCGHVSTFGRGKHMPMPHTYEPCPPQYRKRTSGHDVPYNTRVDCTEVVNRICYEYRNGKTKREKPTIQIKLVSVDRHGKQMPDDALKCQQIALEVIE